MTFHIGKITNSSPKSVLLTNPVAERDTHVLPVQTNIKPPYPPKIEYIKGFDTTYEIAIKKALNIYTGANNWCFWDDGSTDHLVGLSEGNSLQAFFFKDRAASLELRVDNAGTPSFHAL